MVSVPARSLRIANVTAYLQETLSGVRVIRAFGQEGRHLSGEALSPVE
jgi:ABC-type multidrug transport system fused ATPase/permease subunit